MKGECTLKGIEIKNFRSLKDTGILNLSPITVLVGENSSGKSTFLRAFPLIKQSISKRTSGPLLWAGDVDDYVDFGSFEETVTNDGSDSIIFKFTFPLTLHNDRSIYYLDEENRRKKPQQVYDLEYEITISSQKGKEIVSNVKISINNTSTAFDLVNDLIVIDNLGISVRDTDNESFEVKDATGKPIRVRNYYISRSMTGSGIFGFSLPNPIRIWKELYKNFLTLESTESSYELAVFQEAVNIVGELLFQGNSVLDSFSIVRQRTNDKLYYSSAGLRAAKILKALKEHSDSNREMFQAFFKLVFLYSSFTEIEEYVSTYFRQVHYIAPLRATAERYYRLRNLAVDEVDYQGKNLAIYLNSLSNKKLKDFQKWTLDYFGFKIDTDKNPSHLSLRITLAGTDNSINLSDTGFGYSQILPIITQLWELSSRKSTSYGKKVPLVIAIEQPELHLHPAVQAKLASAFIASIRLAEQNGYQLQLILETHSETIVNYFGKAIAKRKLKPEEISIVLFEKQIGSNRTDVKTSVFDSNGFLMNWPYGFFAPGE